MTPSFRLTKPAIKDIEEIADYLAQRNRMAIADNFLDKLNQKLARLAQFPNSGRKRDEILPNMRSIVLDNYLILYLASDGGIDILRVVSGYRDLKTLFDE